MVFTAVWLWAISWSTTWRCFAATNGCWFETQHWSRTVEKHGLAAEMLAGRLRLSTEFSRKNISSLNNFPASIKVKHTHTHTHHQRVLCGVWSCVSGENPNIPHRLSISPLSTNLALSISPHPSFSHFPLQPDLMWNCGGLWETHPGVRLNDLTPLPFRGNLSAAVRPCR